MPGNPLRSEVVRKDANMRSMMTLEQASDWVSGRSSSAVKVPWVQGQYVFAGRAAMFSRSQLKQAGSDFKTNRDTSMRLQRVLALLRLLICEIAVLFAAGIVIPSLFRPFMSAKHALGSGGLHYFTIAHATFPYKFQNLGVAIAGALFGAVVACAVSFPSTISRTVEIARRLQPTRRKYALTGKKGWGGSLRKAA